MPISNLIPCTIPPPTFTPSSLLDLSTKVYLLALPHPLSPTHLSLLTTLYTSHATIYIGCNSPSSYTATSTLLREKCPCSKGILKPFIFNPADLSSVKAAAKDFLSNEDAWRLDVIFLDCTVYSHQGEREAGAKDRLLSSFLLATLLLPRMHSTASHSCHFNPSIRMVWISDSTEKEGRASTAATYHLAKEFARRGYDQLRVGEDRAHAHTLPNSNTAAVQHVVVDTMRPEESRAQRLMHALIPGVGVDPEREACTLLYAGLAPDVRSGDYIVPWGRKSVLPDSVMAGEEGREALWEWFVEQTRDYRE